MEVAIWLVLAAVRAVGGGFAWLLTRRRAPGRDAELEGMRETTEALLRSQRELAGRLSQLAEQSTTDRAELTRALNDRLDAVGKRLSDGLETSTTQTAEKLGQLTKHLEVID